MLSTTALRLMTRSSKSSSAKFKIKGESQGRRQAQTRVQNPPTTEDVAMRYRTIVDWIEWFKVVKRLGDQCNEPKLRFDKLDIFEQAVDVCSQGRLSWVDEVGRDHRDIELNLDIEFKYTSYSMFTKTGRPCKNSRYKIKNSLGKTKSDISNPADFYMFGQENAIGIISYEEMIPYLSVVGDGIAAIIPHDKITYIVTPETAGEIKLDNSDDGHLNYKARKRQMQREFIMATINSK